MSEQHDCPVRLWGVGQVGAHWTCGTCGQIWVRTRTYDEARTATGTYDSTWDRVQETPA